MTHSPVDSISPQRSDRWITSFGMALAAVNVSIAIHVKDGTYDPSALVALTIGLIFATVAIAFPPTRFAEGASRKGLMIVIVIGILLNVLLDVTFSKADLRIIVGSFAIAIMSFLCVLKMPGIKHLAMITMLIAYASMSIHGFRSNPLPHIDVFVFQQGGSQELIAGHDPYAARWRCPYTDPLQVKVFYGPGVVDAKGMLTYGFPYPPLSLCLALPGYIFGNDVRYAHLAALLISALLMAYARPGRMGALVAGLFLLMPRSLYVVHLAWTEPLLLLVFSLTVFCACRYPRLVPYAFGLFLATKQYSILSIPLLFLLIESKSAWRDFFWIMVKAGIVAVIVTAPLFLWNPHEFWHSVVHWQFVQPYRPDALSYLVYFKQLGVTWLLNPRTGNPWLWIPFAAIVPAIALALWRSPKTPAGFAAAVMLVDFVFFALNKQAFCNYYFFVVAVACWAMAAKAPRAAHAV